MSEQIKTYNIGQSSNNSEAKNFLFVSRSTQFNQAESLINRNNINLLNLQKKNKDFEEKIKALNNQIEKLNVENNNMKYELKEKVSENKNLKKELKEKEERITALENEIKLKEREEIRLTRGKIKESGVFNPELKNSELGEGTDVNDLGRSQDDLQKENERLKDEIMLLKKDLELAKEKIKSSKKEFEDEKDSNSNNLLGNNLLKDSYLSLGMNYQNQ